MTEIYEQVIQKHNVLLTEAEKFRDELADMLNFDWRIRGRSGDTPRKRQLLAAFMHEAYFGKIALRDIALLCGYRSRERHSMVLYSVDKIRDFVSIGDKEIMPFYKQLKTVYRNFDFMEYKPEEEMVTYTHHLYRSQHERVKADAKKRNVSMASIVREALDVYYEDQLEKLPNQE